MTQTAAQQKQQKRYVTGAIAVLLANAGAESWQVLGVIMAQLLKLGLSFNLAEWLVNMTAGSTVSSDLGFGEPGPAELIEKSQAPSWRAQYLVAAAERLKAADDVSKASEPVEPGIMSVLVGAMQAEQTYFSQHLYAEERRQRSAAIVDHTARLNADRPGDSNLVGWRAILDARTTAECRAAHGKNWPADKMPAIGYPGSVHVKCRCSVGPAVPGAPLLPTL